MAIPTSPSGRSSRSSSIDSTHSNDSGRSATSVTGVTNTHETPSTSPPPPPPLPPPTELQAQVLNAISNEPKEDTTASEEAGNPSKKSETSDSSRRKRKDSVSSVVPPSLSKGKFKAFKMRTETAFKEGTQAAARAGSAIKDFTETKGAALKVHTGDAFKKCKKGLDGSPLKELKTKATIKFSKLKEQAGSRSKSEKDEKHSINQEESSARRRSSSVSMQSQEMPSNTSSGSPSSSRPGSPQGSPLRSESGIAPPQTSVGNAVNNSLKAYSQQHPALLAYASECEAEGSDLNTQKYATSNTTLRQQIIYATEGRIDPLWVDSRVIEHDFKISRMPSGTFEVNSPTHLRSSMIFTTNPDLEERYSLLNPEQHNPTRHAACAPLEDVLGSSALAEVQSAEQASCEGDECFYIMSSEDESGDPWGVVFNLTQGSVSAVLVAYREENVQAAEAADAAAAAAAAEEAPAETPAEAPEGTEAAEGTEEGTEGTEGTEAPESQDDFYDDDEFDD